MFLYSSAPISSITTYRKDYTEKEVFRPLIVKPVPEYDNPITGPWEEHVLPPFRYSKLPPGQTKYPDPRKYAEEVAEKYPSSRNFIRDCPGGRPDFDIIDRLYENENRTAYMIGYCNLGDYDSKIKRDRTTKNLPDDWVVPLTIYRCSYRDPEFFAPGRVRTTKIDPRKDNLLPNEMERDLLRVTTGDTVYNTSIGKTGEEIIEGKLHGDVNKRPQFNQDELLRAELVKCEWSPGS